MASSTLKYLIFFFSLSALVPASAGTAEDLFRRLEGANTNVKVKEQNYLPTKEVIESIKSTFEQNLRERATLIDLKASAERQRMTKAIGYYRQLLGSSQLSTKSRDAIGGVLSEMSPLIIGYDNRVGKYREFFALADNGYLVFLDGVWQYLDKVEKKAAGLTDPELKEGYLLLAQKDFLSDYYPKWNSYVRSFNAIGEFVLNRTRLIPSLRITKYLRMTGSRACSTIESLDQWPVFEKEAQTAMLLAGAGLKKEPALVYCDEHPKCTNVWTECPSYPVTYSSYRNYLTIHHYLYTGWGYYGVDSGLKEIIEAIH
jgi:hypothetical protein